MSFQIQQNLTNVNCEWGCNSPQWIIIHNTANGTSREGTAWANTNYFKDVNRSASAHYFIDDGDTVWQCVNDWDTAWHIGDSWSHNGATNYNAIGIEVCETADGSFTDHEIAVLSWLVPMLMDRYGIPPERIQRHFDCTGKICPAGYIDEGRWQWLKDQIVSGQGGYEVITDEDIRRFWVTPIDGHKPIDMLLGSDIASNGMYNAYKSNELGERIWNTPIGPDKQKVKARDRLFGIDAASNGCLALLKKIADRIK